jgi:tetratricopeptide (TPR) repeat protein
MAAPATDADTCINASGDAAIAACTRAIDSGKFKESDRAAHYAMRGFELSKKGQHDRAIADYEQAIRFDPGLVWAHAWRGDSYRAKSEFDRAIADYDQAIRINPKLAVAYSKRGNAYRAKGALDRAIADYDQAIKLGPATAIAYTGRGDAYRAKGGNDRAIAEYDQAILLDRRFALAYNGRASAYFQRGDGDRAIADFTQAISLAPESSFSYNGRANAYLRRGDNDRAIADFTRSIWLEPNYAFAYVNRGIAYMNLGQFDRAIADYDAALKRDPRQAYALHGRGFAKLKRGDAGGNADIAAAKALQRDVAEIFTPYGVPVPDGAAGSMSAPGSGAALAAEPTPLSALKAQPSLLPPVALAQASVKAVFEKHNLLGIFARDCGRLASKDNLYYVNRLLDGDYVQVDQMSSPTDRDFVILTDKVGEMNSNEIVVSGMRDGKPTHMILRIERAASGDGIRVRAIEVSWGREKRISEGIAGSGQELPWLLRCGG